MRPQGRAIVVLAALAAGGICFAALAEAGPRSNAPVSPDLYCAAGEARVHLSVSVHQASLLRVLGPGSSQRVLASMRVYAARDQTLHFGARASARILRAAGRSSTSVEGRSPRALRIAGARVRLRGIACVSGCASASRPTALSPAVPDEQSNRPHDADTAGPTGACPQSGIGAPSALTSGVGGTIDSAAINEASGLAASRRDPGVLWTHNDSRDSARIFALDEGGHLLGTYPIAGAAAVDWEDIAVGPGQNAGEEFIYIADTGDNAARRASVVVYRVKAPHVDVAQAPQSQSLQLDSSLTLTYPDGARDAETLLIDPLGGQLVVVSKRDARSRIYSFDLGRWHDGSGTLTYRGSLDWNWAVAGDVSPSGAQVLLKSRTAVRLYQRAVGSGISDALQRAGQDVPYLVEPQGEAITFTCSGPGFFTLSEGSSQPLYRYR